MTATLTMPRARAIEWAGRVASDPTTVFLDLETSGLGDDAEIVDICILGADGRVLLDSLVCPVRPIPAEASAVHGISDDDVKCAPRWWDIAAVVADIVTTAHYAIIYNVAYDSKVIERQCVYSNQPIINANWQCALLAYADFAGVRGRFGSYKWHKLTSAAEDFGIDTPGAHRARADCETTRLVVFAMAREGRPIEQVKMFADDPETVKRLFAERLTTD